MKKLLIFVAAAAVLLAWPLSSLASSLTEPYPLNQTASSETGQSSAQEELSSVSVPEAEPEPEPEQAQGVTLDAESLSLYEGDYVELRVAVESGEPWEPWSSSDAVRCEMVGDSGDPRLRVTALEPGESSVGVSVNGAVKAIPIEVMWSPIRIDTESLQMETGGIYGFVVQTDGREPELTADPIVRIEKVEKNGLPENSWYYEITALESGMVRVCAQLDGYRAAFPASVSQSEMERLAQEYSSPTSWLVLADLDAEKVAVFRGEQGNWRMDRAMLCASGADATPTPKGVYHVQSRGSWFFNESLGEGAQWYVGFWGDYLFHSFPMDRSRKVTDYRLGMPLSHGCIRLRTDEAKWLYDNLPYNSTVVIY